VAIQFPSGGGVDAAGGRGGESHSSCHPSLLDCFMPDGIRKDEGSGVCILDHHHDEIQRAVAIQIPAFYFRDGRKFYPYCIKKEKSVKSSGYPRPY